MGKYTVTMFEYYKGEFQAMGLNEFSHVVDGVNIIEPHKLSFIQKMLNYDDDTKTVTNKLFHGVELSNSEADENFKKAFLNKFLNREIKFQTIEIFSGKLISEMIQQESLISKFFSSDLEKYLDSQNESSNNSSSEDESRNLVSTLPQSEINLDVDNDILTYGDSNQISKSKHSNNNTSKNNNYNMDNLKKIYEMRDLILNDFNKKLFLQIW